jgi:hypothetical protein
LDKRIKISHLTIEQFSKVVENVLPVWSENIEEKKKRHDRTGNLKTFEDKLLALLIYYRTYATHEFIGYFVNLDNSKFVDI